MSLHARHGNQSHTFIIVRIVFIPITKLMNKKLPNLQACRGVDIWQRLCWARALHLQGLRPPDGGGIVDLHGWRPVLVHGRRSSLAGQGAAEHWRRMWCGTGWGRNRGWGLGAGGDDV